MLISPTCVGVKGDVLNASCWPGPSAVASVSGPEMSLGSPGSGQRDRWVKRSMVTWLPAGTVAVPALLMMPLIVTWPARLGRWAPTGTSSRLVITRLTAEVAGVAVAAGGVLVAGGTGVGEPATGVPLGAALVAVGVGV